MKHGQSRHSMGWDASFAQRADSGDLTIGIIGLGYVGLPTAIGFRDAGFLGADDAAELGKRHGMKLASDRETATHWSS